MNRYIFIVALLLAACGGGSNEPADTPVNLSASSDSAALMTNDFLLLNELVLADFGSSLAAILADDGDIPLLNKRQLQNRKLPFLQRMPQAEGEAISCESGSGNAQFSGDLVTRQGTFELHYEHCRIDGITLNGFIKQERLSSVLAVNSEVRVTLDLAVVAPLKDLRYAGVLTQTASQGEVLLANSSLSLRNNVTGRLTRHLGVTLDHGVMSGRMSSSGLGYVDISTLQPLKIAAPYLGGDAAPSGIIVLTGADQARVQIWPEAPKLVGEPVPGQELQSFMLRWGAALYLGDAPVPVRERLTYVFYSGDSDPPVAESLAPAINFPAGPTWAPLGQVFVLDGSTSTDVNHDLLAFNWELVSKPAASHLALAAGQGARPNVNFDATGHYVFRLTVSDGSHTVQELLPVEVYFSARIDSTGANMPADGYLLDEAGQRLLGLRQGEDSTLQAIDIVSGQVSPLFLPAAPANASSFALSPDGQWLVLAGGGDVVVFNARTLLHVGTFALPSGAAPLDTPTISVRITDSGKVYFSYYRIDLSKASGRGVSVLELDFSGSPVTAHALSWGDDGTSLPGRDWMLVAVDEARQRVVISDRISSMRAASTLSRTQVAEQPLDEISYRYWYEPGSGMIFSEGGEVTSALTLASAGRLQVPGRADTLAPLGNGGVVWYGWDAAVPGYVLRLFDAIDQQPVSLNPPSRVDARFAGYHNAPSDLFYAQNILVSGDGSTQYWIAAIRDPAVSEQHSVLEFIRY